MAARRRAVEYRSEQAWGTLPLVHVAVGGRQAGGRYRLGRARGVIALGDVATGLVAVGAVAVGLFAAGAVAVGLTAVGAVTAGLLVGPRPPGGIAPSGSCRPRTGARVAASRLMEAPRGR
jgi:hypothetical protein